MYICTTYRRHCRLESERGEGETEIREMTTPTREGKRFFIKRIYLACIWQAKFARGACRCDADAMQRRCGIITEVVVVMVVEVKEEGEGEKERRGEEKEMRMGVAVAVWKWLALTSHIDEDRPDGAGKGVLALFGV